MPKGDSCDERDARELMRRQYLMFHELVRSPRSIGALCASSKWLARTMASAVPKRYGRLGCVVELGAGTGSITGALLDRGIAPSALHVVERSEVLCAHLVDRFPSIEIYCCGAEDIAGRLPRGTRVGVVVSSLPFRSLPVDVARRIMRSIDDMLVPGGIYIQFTYALIGEIPNVPRGFRKVGAKLVLRNVPPAKVEIFRKRRLRSLAGS